MIRRFGAPAVLLAIDCFRSQFTASQRRHDAMRVRLAFGPFDLGDEPARSPGIDGDVLEVHEVYFVGRTPPLRFQFVGQHVEDHPDSTIGAHFAVAGQPHRH